jgi:hypothetical protein
MTLHQQYNITQIVLRKIIKREYSDKSLRIKICYFRFANNRTQNNFNETFKEKVWIYSKTQLNDTQKKELELLLILNFERIELSLKGKSGREIIGVDSIFVCPA